MGIRLFGGSCSRSSSVTRPVTDPNPSLFSIKRLSQVGKCVVGVINYPNCTTFNGDKILVWHKRYVDQINNMKLIDPHFLDSDRSLIARFRPTKKGWEMALQLAELLNKE